MKWLLWKQEQVDVQESILPTIQVSGKEDQQTLGKTLWPGAENSPKVTVSQGPFKSKGYRIYSMSKDLKMPLIL